MSRLPRALQPAWPIFKRAHRFLALASGVLFRRLAPLMGPRRLPRTASLTSANTAEQEPESVRIHPSGAAERLIRSMPTGSPPSHWAFTQALEVDVPARYTLEIAHGTVVGDFAAVITTGGTLDYQTSGYFGLASWREHPLFLKPRLPPLKAFEGTLLNLTSGGTSSNYYHFVFDVLPRYGIFEESLPDTKVDGVLAPHRARYQRELLELVGISQPLIQPDARISLRADRLIVPSAPNRHLTAPRWVVQWLRTRLPPSMTATSPSRIYITRGDRPNTRRYVEEHELWPMLERRGFVKVDPGALTVQQQIDIFSTAEVVVAPHGAGLTNLVFCPPGVRVLELFASTYVHLGLWAISQALDDVEYHYLVSDLPDARGREGTGVLTDIRIPATRVIKMVDGLL